MKGFCGFCSIAVVCLSVFAGAQSNPAPVLGQSFEPVSAKPGGSAFTLTVHGSGFAPTSVLNWNGSARPTAVISGTQIMASIGASDIAKAKTAWITVTNPAPGGGTS